MASRAFLSQAAKSKHAPLSDALVAHLLRPLKNPPHSNPPVAPAAFAPKSAPSAPPPSSHFLSRAAADASAAASAAAAAAAAAAVAFPPAATRPERLRFKQSANSSAATNVPAAIVPLLLNVQAPTVVSSIADPRACAVASAEAESVPVVSWNKVLPAADAEPTVVVPLPVFSLPSATPAASSAAAPSTTATATAEKVTLPKSIQDILDGLMTRKTASTSNAAPSATATLAVKSAKAPTPSNSTATSAATPATATTATSIAAPANADPHPHPTLVMLPDDFPFITSPMGSPPAEGSPLSAYVSDTSAISGPTNASSARHPSRPLVAFTIGSPADDLPAPDSPPARTARRSPPLTSPTHAVSSPTLFSPNQDGSASAAANPAKYLHPHFQEARLTPRSADRRAAASSSAAAAAAAAASAAASPKPTRGAAAGAARRAGGKSAADESEGWRRKAEPSAAIVPSIGLSPNGQSGGFASGSKAVGYGGGAPLVKPLGPLYLPYSTVAVPAAEMAADAPCVAVGKRAAVERSGGGRGGSARGGGEGRGVVVSAIGASGPRMPDGTRGFTMGRGKRLV
eukprot:TRINITY_DN5802_c0_g1_i2.p1 TRINITY_DN5802_c0_g1~~TRINITY_DN5802_c0_g1_i2.p1  ORF type:complete len:572 (+),score=-23.12 TRINITY_DN5802_c0_g1_i2:249-1964(+)